MERLEPKREPRSWKDFGKLLFYGFVAAMTVLGIWFTVQYKVPQQTQVEKELTAVCLSAQQETRQIRLSGQLSHYRLGNEEDLLKGSITVGDQTFALEARYAPGSDYGMAQLPGGGMLLIHRDQSALLMEYTGPDGALQLLLVGQEAEFARLLEENPQWEKELQGDWTLS